MKYVICYVKDTNMAFIGKDRIGKIEDAIEFDNLPHGKEYLAKFLEDYDIKGNSEALYYLVVPKINIMPTVESMVRMFPGPDFFEIHRPLKADNILSILSDKNFDKNFRACDEIDEAGCWSSGAMYDPSNFAYIGHRVCFSFDGSINQQEGNILTDGITSNPNWSKVLIHRKGQGSAQWIIVELQAYRR